MRDSIIMLSGCGRVLGINWMYVCATDDKTKHTYLCLTISLRIDGNKFNE